MPKNLQTTIQLHSSHMLAKECSKSSKPGFNSTWTMNFQMDLLPISRRKFQMELPELQAGFRKGRGTRDQIANIRWIIEKARAFQKNIYFCFIDYSKAFDCVDHHTLWQFWKRWEYQTTWPASWEICMQVKKQQNRTWNNRMIPNRERSTSGLYIVDLII